MRIFRFDPVFKVLSCLFLILFGSPDSSAQATWSPVPIYTSRNLFEIEYFDGQGIVAVGDSGLVVWKGNAGSEWTQLQAPTLSSLVSVEKLKAGSGNSSRNYFLAKNRKAYRFGILGTTVVEDTLPGWPSIPVNANRLVNLHISTLNETRYGLSCDGGQVMAYKSDLNPTSSQIQLSSLRPIQDLYPFNSWFVLAVGDSGKIWRTSSLTVPLTPINQPHTSEKLNRIFGKNDSQIWIVGKGGILLSSSNAGLDWAKIALPTTQNLNAGFVKGSAIWICGDGGTLLLSKDNGANWQMEISNTTANLHDIKQIGNNVYAVGENGAFITVNLILANERLTSKSPIRIWIELNQVFLISDLNQISNVLISNMEGRNICTSTQTIKNGLALTLPQNGLYVLRIEMAEGQIQFHKVLIQD